MKICAITMVYRDHWALAQWYAHYGAMLGAENLYIVAHGPDPEVERICPEASVITIAREKLRRFENRRNRFLNGLQQALEQIYDWVIRTDVDELICLDPELHGSMADMLAKQGKARAVFALGLDLFERRNDAPFSNGENVFTLRREARPYGHYSKAFAVRGGTELVWHGVRVPAEELETFPHVLPDGVYLVHLKYANTAALQEADAHRVVMAEDCPDVANNWHRAPLKSKRYLRNCRALPRVGWAEAVTEARRTCRENVKRDAARNIVRTRMLHFEYATRLPDWFADVAGGGSRRA